MPNLDDHYLALDLQPIEAIRAWSKTWGAYSYYLGNIIKYAARMFTKDTPRSNLEKMRYYLDQLEEALGPAKWEIPPTTPPEGLVATRGLVTEGACRRCAEVGRLTQEGFCGFCAILPGKL